MPNPAAYPSDGQMKRESHFEELQLGWGRLRDQERLILSSKALGRPTMEAERLAALLRGTSTEWGRHRDLIAGRLAYLRARLDQAARQA